LAPKIVRGTEVPGAGKHSKLPVLIQMGDWCGAFDADAKDYDITGAMYVNNDGNDLFNAVFGRDLFRVLTEVG